MAMTRARHDQSRSTPDTAGSAEPAALAAAASLFRSLGDPSRLAILGHLMLGERRVVDLTDPLGLAQSTVSAHLRCLLDGGVVTVRARGGASVYALVAPVELLAVLAAAEGLLGATGDAVVPCPRYSPDAGAAARRRRG